jgi:hypothetical protein
MLVVVTGDRRDRIAPLPTGPDPPGEMLAAFPLPLATLEEELQFALELDEATVVELGVPSRHEVSRRPRRATVPPVRPERAADPKPIRAPLPVAPAGDSTIDRWLSNTLDALQASDDQPQPSTTEPDVGADGWLTSAERTLHGDGPEPTGHTPRRPQDGGSAADRLRPYLLQEPEVDPAEALDRLIAELSAIEPRRAARGDPGT